MKLTYLGLLNLTLTEKTNGSMRLVSSIYSCSSNTSKQIAKKREGVCPACQRDGLQNSEDALTRVIETS